MAEAPATDAAALLAEAWRLCYLDPLRAAEPARALAAGGDALAPWGWWHLAFADTRAGDPARAAAALARAAEGFERSSDARGLLLVDETHAIRLRREGRVAESLALHEAIDARAEAARPLTDQFIAHNSRAITHKALGNVDDALRHFHAARDAAEASGNVGARITALGNLGGYQQDLYNLDDAREMSERAFRAARAARSPRNLTGAACNLIILHYALGQPVQAREMAEFLLGHPDELPPDALEHTRTTIALGHLAVGEIDEALLRLDAGGLGNTPGERAAAAHTGIDTAAETAAFWAWLRTRCALAKGDAAGARALAERTLAERARRGLVDSPFDLMELHRALADACELLGDTAAALACVRRAQALYEQLVGRSVRARRVALQIGFDLARAQRERDLALDSQRAVEADRQRLAELNAALERQIAENEQLQARLTEQALRDPLTGLHNRRYLFEVAPGLLELARREGRSLAVVLLDLDHFKLLNDTYGHLAGDLVLQRFADLLRETVRRSDIVCRHGGEEFVVLMPAVDGDGAVELLARVLEAFQQTPADAAGRRRAPRCTFSAGVAVFPLHGNTLEQLLSRADRALYRAKQQGRARIEQVPCSSFATLP